MIEPIRPENVIERKRENFPDEVIEIFNELIAQKFDGRSSNIKQEEVARLIGEALSISYAQILKDHLLDVEDFYRKVGWSVKYDKPSYGDSDFEAYFLFTKKTK